MTTSATEQPDVDMDSSLAVRSATELSSPVADMKWEIHVEFNNGMWWAMPHDLSDAILEQWTNGAHQVSVIWGWQATRKGSYQPNGADTSISRCIIHFDTMRQSNIGNDRTRKVQVVYILL